MTSILLLVLSCGTEKEPDERNVAPIGSPFPMDTSDTVVDNPGLVPGNLYGTIEFTGNLPAWGGTCDSTYTLTGTPYEGYCPGCTFNFEVVSRQTRDDDAGCPAPDEAPLWLSFATYRLGFWQYKIVFQFSDFWTGTAYYYTGSVSNDPALAWGVEFYPDALVWPIAYEGSPYGTIVDVTDSTIDWTFDWSYYDTYYGTGLNELHAVGSAYIVQ